MVSDSRAHGWGLNGKQLNQGRSLDIRDKVNTWELSNVSQQYFHLGTIVLEIVPNIVSIVLSWQLVDDDRWLGGLLNTHYTLLIVLKKTITDNNQGRWTDGESERERERETDRASCFARDGTTILNYCFCLRALIEFDVTTKTFCLVWKLLFGANVWRKGL